MPSKQVDAVDSVLQQWSRVRPDVDVSPMAVIGRISRLSRFIDRRLSENFARFGVEDWEYDMLATLRRHDAPYELSAGELTRQTMVTTGAITNRIDRLENRELVVRVSSTDRRKVIVRLTSNGLTLVDSIVAGHMETEHAILSALSDRQRNDLSNVLRSLLISLGDLPSGT
jgi:DNA-binding MarR family transcriptional regulator